MASILNQEVNVEHILVDGASTDGTLTIVEESKEKFSYVISEPDKGIYDAMNKGLVRANGDVIGILNADDFYPTDDVLKKVACTFNDPDIDACYGDLIYVDNLDYNKPRRYWRAENFDPKKFYWGWMPPHPTFFVRKSVYDKYGLFNLELGSAADYEIMLRFLLKYKVKTVYIPKVLVHMRMGGISNATIWNRIRANKMDRKAWEVNELKPYPWTLLAKPVRKIGQWTFK